MLVYEAGKESTVVGEGLVVACGPFLLEAGRPDGVSTGFQVSRQQGHRPTRPSYDARSCRQFVPLPLRH